MRRGLIWAFLALVSGGAKGRWLSAQTAPAPRTVMRADEHVNGADAVVRAHQVEFLVDREIARMKRSEPPEREVRCHRLRIFGNRLGRPSWNAAGRIRLAGPRQRSGNDLACRCDDARRDTGKWDRVAGLGHGMRPLCVQSRIGRIQESIGRFGWLDVRAVIDEVPNGKA